MTLVAVHTNGFRHMVRKLLAEGFYASQIRILYNPKAKSANLTVTGNGADNIIEWSGDKDRRWSSDSATHDLGYWVKKISGYM